MAFKPFNTADETTSYLKTLVYANAGWGKTTQAKYYQKKYGKGFVLSGESGLSSIRGAGIDYLPFSSFDGAHDPDKGVFSFKGIVKMMLTKEFKDQGYKWIMVDSITELSDMVMEYATAQAEATAVKTGKKVNGFEKFATYNQLFLASCKFIRDLPYHVVLSALSVESDNEDGAREVYPNVQGAKMRSQLMGIFDNVLAGVKVSVKGEDGKVSIKRYVITDDIRGYHAKVRDEKRRVLPIEDTASIVDVLSKIEN